MTKKTCPNCGVFHDAQSDTCKSCSALVRAVLAVRVVSLVFRRFLASGGVSPMAQDSSLVDLGSGASRSTDKHARKRPASQIHAKPVQGSPQVQPATSGQVLGAGLVRLAVKEG